MTRKVDNSWLDQSDIWWSELQDMWAAGKRNVADWVPLSSPTYSIQEVDAFLSAVYRFPTMIEIARRKFPGPGEDKSGEWYRGDPEKIKRNESYNEASVTSFFLEWFVLKNDIQRSCYWYDRLLGHVRRAFNADPDIDLPAARKYVLNALEGEECLKS